MKPITVTATISAEVSSVWTFYTQPEHITQWNFASPEWCCPSASNDLTVGGKYVARMEAKDKSFGFDFEAIYTQVEPERKLAYTMGTKIDEGRKAIVEFKPIDNQTEVTIIFDPESENPIDMQRDGWQAILNNFKAHCENQS